MEAWRGQCRQCSPWSGQLHVGSRRAKQMGAEDGGVSRSGEHIESMSRRTRGIYLGHDKRCECQGGNVGKGRHLGAGRRKGQARSSAL
jgi:hypothetical protein